MFALRQVILFWQHLKMPQYLFLDYKVKDFGTI